MLPATVESPSARTDSGARQRGRRRLYEFGGVYVGILLRRIGLAVPLLLVVSVLTFVVISLTPGDPARQILGVSADPASYHQLRVSLGLNLPLPDQYWHWLKGALSGNLGTSLSTTQPVTEAISQRLPVTLSLVFCSLVVTGVVGIGLGVFVSLRGGWLTRTVDLLGLLAFALPNFWLASELVSLFAVKIHWFPVIGYTSFSASPVEWVRSLVLPVLSLSLASVAFVARQTKEAMAEVIDSEYVRMARAHGLSQPTVILRYVLRNAAAPVVTVLGVQLVALLSGTVFVENVFSLPGLGSLVTQAALNHDIAVVEGVAVVFTIIVIIVNTLIDLSYSWLNPKVRLS